MSDDRNPIWEDLDGLQMDLRAASAKLVALRAKVAQLDMPDKPSYRCRFCGITAKSARAVAEHEYDIHDAERPAHLAAIEAKIAPDWTPDEEAA